MIIASRSPLVGLLCAALLISCASASPSSATSSSSSGATTDGGSTSASCAETGGDDAGGQTQRVVDAANSFLATFASTAAVQFSFDRPAKSSQYVGAGNRLGEQYGSAIWSNYPVSDVPRPGVQRGSLNDTQIAAEDALLRAALSDGGFQKINQIMGADQALCSTGQQFSCGTAVYTIGIFGTPSTTAPWMIEFGGHHLGLNIIIDGTKGTVAPTLTGAQPAVYTAADGTQVRALAAENDKAFALLNSLDETQKSQAVTSAAIGDLVLGPGHDNTDIVPEGVKGSSLTSAQKALLLDVITEWAGIVHPAYACSHLADIQSDLDETYFLWSGPTTHADGANGSTYYRIQGPKVVIEFAPQGGGPGGSDPTNHVHTVYRDPTNEYGHAW